MNATSAIQSPTPVSRALVPRSVARRKWVDRALRVVSAGAALIGIVVLVWILGVVLMRGGAAINWNFFTHTLTPPGIAGGGVANAILGTLILVAMSFVVGVPVGLLAGVFLAEFGRGTRLGSVVRFSTNVLMGVPSIIVGLFIYTLVVLPLKQFSGWSAALALAILMLPVVARTTEDMLALVPNALRESALALGAPRWRVTIGIVFRAAKTGLITGVLLAVARISGETAPLLFTCSNNEFNWPQPFSGPMANLTVTIYRCADNPNEEWKRLAWGAAFLITLGVLVTTLVARLALRRK